MELNEKDAEKKEYNPFEHRQVEKPNSDVRSAANLIKSSLGSGLLAGPLAFSNSGWGVGLISTIVIGFICGHCIQILVKTSRGCCILDKRPSLNYAETCKSAFTHGPKALKSFANSASVFAEFALVSTYLGVCCIYVVLISDSVKQLVDRYIPSYILPVEYYCLILLLPLCLLCQIKYLKWLAIFSLMANLLLFATYLICLYYVFKDDLSIEGKKIAGDAARFPAFVSTVIFAMEGVGVVMPVENEMKKPKNFLGFPGVLVVAMAVIVFLYSTLGLFGYLRYGEVLQGSITLKETTKTVIFAMEGVGVVMPVENEMKKPKNFLGFPGVLVVAMAVIVFLYSTLGLFGYLRYGEVLQGSITLNLPTDDWPAICAKLFIALSIFFTFPLQFFIAFEVFVRYTQPHIKKNYQFISLLGGRILGVCFCVAVAIALPLLEQIINIVGAFFYSTLGIIIPGVTETVFRWNNLGKYKWVLWKNIIIILFGLLTMISGCTVTILDIIHIVKNRTV